MNKINVQSIAHTKGSSSADAPLLSLQSVSVAYGQETVVHQVDLDFYAGEIGSLLGPSGCGKSTILRAIAGFEPIQSGEIYLAGEMISSASSSLPPEQRNVGIVFQDFALFPHLTVADNIAFGIRRWPSREKHQRVSQLLEMVDLVGYDQRYPHELSGGQQQRIALARAIAPRPKLLLLDEPFASLDVEMREKLVPLVRDVLIREGVAGLLVTHDQIEAFGMADRIAVITAGQVEQYDTGYQLYHAPKTQFVADFIGKGAMITAEARDAYSVHSALGELRSQQPHRFSKGDAVHILVRPDDIALDAEHGVMASIRDRRFQGEHFMYEIALESGEQIYCYTPADMALEIGESISVRCNINHLVIFAASSKTQPNATSTVLTAETH